jgi:Tfp pilus assembly protein PilF
MTSDRWRQRRTRASVAVFAVVVMAVLGACSDGKKDAANSSGAGSGSPVDQLLDEGLQAQNAGQLDVAKQKYLDVLKLDPTNKIAYYDLGVLYQQQSDVANARDSYQKAILADSKYQPALFNLAILETPVNPARAEELYRQLLTINQKDANVHFNLGLLLKQVGRQQEGDAEIQTAVSIDPSLSSRIPASSTADSSSAESTSS